MKEERKGSLEKEEGQPSIKESSSVDKQFIHSSYSFPF